MCSQEGKSVYLPGAETAKREQTRRMHRCEWRGASRKRKQQIMIRMYDIQRWAKSMLERIYSLDGERVHPHPGMSPTTAPQRRTASELAQGEKWETRENLGWKYISYKYDTHTEQRFHTAEVVFPDGTEGVGLFADREFQKGEYITAWMGTPVSENSQTTARLEGGLMEAHPRGGASYINDTRQRIPRINPNAELTRHGNIKAAREIKNGEEICIEYGEKFWAGTGPIQPKNTPRRTIISVPIQSRTATPGSTQGNTREAEKNLLGFIAYTIEKTRTGTWVLFIEEILSTGRARGRNLKIGRRLLREAILAATRDERATEIHLIIRGADQQIHAANLYTLYGMGRQEQRHTKNRVQLDEKLARTEQYWTGTMTAATEADQVGCPRVEGGIERYEGLREATPGTRAAIRTAFEEGTRTQRGRQSHMGTARKRDHTHSNMGNGTRRERRRRRGSIAHKSGQGAWDNGTQG